MGNYIQKTLNQNEEIKGVADQHWIALLPRGIIAIIFLLSGITGGDITMFIAFIIIALLLMINPIIRFFTTELAFTNKRLIGKIGFINTKALDSPLNKINNVSVSNGFFGKIFGYGNVHITTSSGSYIYKGIAHPDNYKTSLMNQIDQFDEDRIKKQASEMANAMKNI